MSSLGNKQLVNLIRYAPVALVFVFALAVNLIALDHNRKQAAKSIDNLREELTFQRKDAVRSEVHEVHRHLLVEKSNIESNLKEAAKQRVYEAHSIANYIYAKNIGKQSNAEIRKQIVDALRAMRFFDGRGYFFIVAEDGTTIMNGENSTLEGQHSVGLHDEIHDAIAQSVASTASLKEGEGFIRWHVSAQQSGKNKGLDKVGYIKKFEPYHWSIGTGESFSDFESDIKTKLLTWLSTYEYGENGYFFVLDKQGTLLAHHANDFLGLDFVIGQKIKDSLLTDINHQISKGDGFIQYQKPLTVSGNTSLDQLSYVKKVPGWDWIIGTGFSTQAFEKSLREKEAQLVASNRHNVMRLIYLTIGSVFLFTLVSWYVGHLIAKRFESFQQRINADFDALNNSKSKMEYMALHDELTGLPNRVLMIDDIQAKIEQSSAVQSILAVMFVDLDNFKNINDLYGHHTGDLLLAVVSQRFKAVTNASGNVYRFGGDEFVFCFPRLKTKKEADDKAQLIREALRAPIAIDDKLLSISCTVGVSMYPEDATDPEDLISQADTVLYKSKADKKGEVLFYNSFISDNLKRKMEVQHALAHAINHKDLTVFYQPQMRASDEKLVSVEALVRWEHATMGHIYPDEFIPIAEESGMIHGLDLFVFRRACEDILALSPNGNNALKLSVNMSPAYLLEPGFLNGLLDICAEVGIDKKRITLEITENIFIHGFDTVQPILRELRAQGFGLSLDDFGTGYSSLSYINSLPLTEIKIDRGFINKFLESHQSDMLVRMIIDIGQVCGLSIVAEGVEIKPQLDKLQVYGCDLLQGYYFDRPLTIKRLSEKFLNPSA